MKDRQRKGQRLANYIRFIKDKKENIPPSEFETYLFYMSDEEYDKAVSLSHEWPNGGRGENKITA